MQHCRLGMRLCGVTVTVVQGEGGHRRRRQLQDDNGKPVGMRVGERVHRHPARRTERRGEATGKRHDNEDMRKRGRACQAWADHVHNRQEPYRASLRVAEADVSSARAAVASAQLELEGKRQLRRSGVVADYDVSQAQCTLDEQLATLRNAEAKLATARTDLSYTEVKSPADGVIGMINYRLGALVSSSIDEPLTTVADVSSVHAYFSVTESEAQRLVADHGSLDKAIATLPCVKLRLGSGEELSAEGTVDAVSGNVDEATGSVAMRATFANPSRILFSGGSATIVIPYKYTNRIIIPQEATYEIQDKKFVYRVVDGKTKSKEITVEPLSDGKRYVVTDGLKKGDVIVAEGAGLLSDGMEIKVKK